MKTRPQIQLPPLPVRSAPNARIEYTLIAFVLALGAIWYLV